MTIPRLLIVDDDPDMCEMMARYLRDHGFAVMTAASEEGIRDHLSRHRVDLVLLDVMLGEENGVAICRRLRAERDVPIILVSALSADHQRMAGYEVGADDYIAKPFNPDLMLAQVRAVLRRVQRTPSLAYRRNTRLYRFAGWAYDARRDEVLDPDGVQVSLSRRETALLLVLLANPRIPLSREEIAAALDADTAPDTAPGSASGGQEPGGRAIDMLVGRLRGKIEADPHDPRLLRTERGVGYVLAADVDAAEG